MGARRVIGLTGDVGCGKSSVRAWLEGQGAAALDADVVVHGLLRDPAVVAAVLAAFGPELRGPAGELDRAALAARVFGRPAALAALEAILHPRVIAAARTWLAARDGGTAVIEAVKLIEAGMARDMDEVWLVVCDRATRLARLAARGWSPDEVARRMAAAGPLGPRLAVADVVIDNSGPWAATAAQLAPAWAGPSPGVRAALPGGGR